MVPRAVLIKSGLVSINIARQVNTAHSKTTVNAARPMPYLSKTAHSTVKSPIHKNTAFKNSNIDQRVNTISGKKFNTARQKVVVNAVKRNNVNAIKASACWVWKLKNKVLDNGNPQMDLQDQGVIDSGCSRHMIGNMSYLTDYEKIDGGYVAFGGNHKGGKIIGKDEAIHKELGDSLVRAATTASSLEEEEDSGNITKTRSKATPNESSSLGTTSGGGPRRQETMRDTIAQTRFENVSKLSNDSLLTRGNTLRSDEDRLKLNELMELCTDLQKKILDLEKTKTTQANEISTRVESSGDEEKLGDDASKQGRRINAIDVDEDITLVSVQHDANKEIFDVDTLDGEEVFVAEQNENVVEEVVDAAQVITKEITLAQALADLKSRKPKAKRIAFRELEPEKPLKKKDQLKLDEEIALKLLAGIDKEERIARAEEEKIAEEQEQFIIKEKATLFKELLEQRRKHFAAKRAEEKRNKPPTKTQQKKIMITYLKNMEVWKHKDLKSKDFDSIKELFDKAFTRINMFVDFRTELVEGSSKRVREELEQESTKKQKVDEDKDTSELQSLMKVIPDEEEVAIDVVPLATKSPTIVD
ncbi:hypothetical protein Tco_1407766 [Tanacetum coccineum]